MRGVLWRKGDYRLNGMIGVHNEYSSCMWGARRVGGYAADASIVIGSDIPLDDLAASDHRVGGAAANPTRVALNAWTGTRPPHDVSHAPKNKKPAGQATTGFHRCAA